MRSAVTVSLVPEAKGGPFVFWDGLEDACSKAAGLGFDAIEIFPSEASAIDVAAVQDLVARHKLKVAAIGTGGGWVRHKLLLTHADAAIRRDAREFVRAIVDRAGALGAPAILGSMQGRWDGSITREQALVWLAEAVEDIAEHAAAHRVPFLVEPLNRYEGNIFNRLGEATAWVRTLRTRNVRVLADLFHLSIEEASLPSALREAGPLLGHVHFADSNRQAVGFGHTDMPPIVAALRAIRYDGYLSAEIRPLPDSISAATQTINAYRNLLGCV